MKIAEAMARIYQGKGTLSGVYDLLKKTSEHPISTTRQVKNIKKNLTIEQLEAMELNLKNCMLHNPLLKDKFSRG